jgi:hypothetical protein
VTLHAWQHLSSLLLSWVTANFGATYLLVQDDASLFEVLLVENESLQLLRLALRVDVERDDLVGIVDVVGVLLGVNLRLVVLDVRFFTTIIDSGFLITAIDGLPLLIDLLGALSLGLTLLISFSVAVLSGSVFGRLATVIDRLDVAISAHILHVFVAPQLVTLELLLHHAEASVDNFLRASDRRRLASVVTLAAAGR